MQLNHAQLQMHGHTHLPLVQRMKPRVSIATPVFTTRSPMYQLINELLPAEWLPTIITLHRFQHPHVCCCPGCRIQHSTSTGQHQLHCCGLVSTCIKA